MSYKFLHIVIHKLKTNIVLPSFQVSHNWRWDWQFQSA